MSCYGVLLNPGPGDALRFLHGFCELLKYQHEDGMVFCLPEAYQKVCRLFFAAGQKISLVECADCQQINLKLRVLPKTEVWHCYDIKFIDCITKCLPKAVTHHTNHIYHMIDRFDSHRYMAGQIADHLKIPVLPQKHKGLLFLRNMSVRPERNMNMTILQAIISVSKEMGILYDTVDGNDVEEWNELVRQVQDKKLYVDHYPDYLAQIHEYSRYSFAIGMNSGGLDMAIASGIHAIRIGEFHQYYNWLGLHYNDFLSSNRTVNIASRSETDVSNVGEDEIRKAFEQLFSKCEQNILWINCKNS